MTLLTLDIAHERLRLCRISINKSFLSYNLYCIYLFPSNFFVLSFRSYWVVQNTSTNRMNTDSSNHGWMKVFYWVQVIFDDVSYLSNAHTHPSQSIYSFCCCFSGKKWHERRKIITPAFHFKILEQFVEVFDRIGNVVVDKLKQYDPTDDVEFYPIAVLYALDVMCGKQLNCVFLRITIISLHFLS